MTAAPLLTVRDLHVCYGAGDAATTALAGVNVETYPGEVLAVVGESGAGKSTLALALMGLLPSPPACVRLASLELEGRELAAPAQGRGAEQGAASGNVTRELARLRGHAIALVPQDASTALNPFLTVAQQLAEVLTVHRRRSQAQARDEVRAMLARVGFADAAAVAAAYPHELSGGMRQRVAVAMAELCEPALVIADEPTAALDPLTRDEVLQLLATLRRARGGGLIFISHDLGLVRSIADRVLVMQAGRIVEEGPTARILSQPQHAHTRELVDAASLDGEREAGEPGYCASRARSITSNR